MTQTNGPLPQKQYPATVPNFATGRVIVPKIVIRTIGTGTSSGTVPQPINQFKLSAEVIEPSETREIKPLRSDEEILAALGPIERWKFLARHRTGQFLALILTAVAWFYAATSAWSGSSDAAALTTEAFAAESNSSPVAQAAEGTILNVHDVDLICLIAFVAWCLGALTFAKESSRIKFAQETAKTLLGFIIGIFVAKKA